MTKTINLDGRPINARARPALVIPVHKAQLLLVHPHMRAAYISQLVEHHLRERNLTDPAACAVLVEIVE